MHMGASDGRGRCREAAQYYYDLGHHDEAAVPEEIRRHVAGCAFCQERMRRLGESLAGIDDGPGGPAGPEDGQTVETLSRHLDLMDQQVTCAQVKPFLPSLLVSAPKIRVPTPVTVHVDRCPACAADLAALRALGLTAEQLERLARLYGTPTARQGKACRQARPHLAAWARLALGDVPTEILDHVSTCPSCRAEVYRRRQEAQTAPRQDATSAEAVACSGGTPADLFDLVVPYGLAPASGVEAAAAHVRTCPACREQLQALHRTLYGIAERPDSGVATVYRTTDNAEQDAVKDMPTRCPVQVQVLYQEPAPTAAGAEGSRASAGAARHTLTRRGTKSLLKIACAAAVIALIAVQFTRSPTAVGLNAGDILKTLEKAPNVHIISYMSGVAEPSHEKWIASRLKKFAQKSPNERVLYDLNAARMRVITSDGEDETVRMTRAQCYSIGEIMVAQVEGVLTSISGQMRRRELTPVADTAGGRADGLAVYELSDDRPAGGEPTERRRWRVVVDSATGLPQRLEHFCKWPPEGEWESDGCEVFKYPSEREMADTLAALFPPQ
jgi:hypothetical protein